MTRSCKVAFLVAAGAFFTLFYCYPWLLFGQDASVRIHDSLDVMFAWYTLLAREDIWFADNQARIVPIMLGGTYRVSLPSELTPVSLLFALLPPFDAYVAHQLLIRFVAFTGMVTLCFALLSREAPWPTAIALAGGAVFAAMPFWGWSGVTAAAPWAAVAILNLMSGRHTLLSCLILVAYASFSGLVFGGFAVVGLLWLLVSWALVRKRSAARPLFAGALVATASYLVVDYRLILFMLDPFFVPHRVEFVVGHTDWRQALHFFWLSLSGSDVWISSVKGPVILALTVATFVPLVAIHVLRVAARLVGLAPPRFLALQLRHPGAARLSACLLTILALTVTATTALVAFWESEAANALRDSIPLLGSFNISRVISFNPMIWALIFVACISLLAIWLPRRLAIGAIGSLAVLQVTAALEQHEHFVEQRATGISFREFYAAGIFARIADDLELVPSETLTASVGLHPSIAQVNGFRTVDAYLNLYPLDAKHRFRNIVEEEFSRDPTLLSYFDHWGSRAYLFSSEVLCPRNGAVCRGGSGHEIQNMLIDTHRLRREGVSLIFSAVPIGNFRDLGLEAVGIYACDESAWAIHVYRLD